MADARDMVGKGDGERCQLGGGADAGMEEEAGGVDCTGAEDGFLFGAEGEFGTGVEGHVDAGDGGGAVDVNTGNPSVGEDGEVRTFLGAPQDGVDIGDTGGRACACIRIIGYGEESYTLIEVALGRDFPVEVRDDGDV